MRMHNKKRITVYFVQIITILLVAILTSCASEKPVRIKGWNEYTGSEKQNFILKVRAIQETTSSYAFQRSQKLSLKSSDIIRESEPIYIHKNEIPQMSNRIEVITDKIEATMRELSSDVQNTYLHLILREQLNSDTFQIYISDGSRVDYTLSKYQSTIKSAIRTSLDKLYNDKDIYSEWDGIFSTYNEWRASIENIKDISNLSQLEVQKDISLLDVTTELFYAKWKTELSIGEDIAKIQAEM